MSNQHDSFFVLARVEVLVNRSGLDDYNISSLPVVAPLIVNLVSGSLEYIEHCWIWMPMLLRFASRRYTHHEKLEGMSVITDRIDYSLDLFSAVMTTPRAILYMDNAILFVELSSLFSHWHFLCSRNFRNPDLPSLNLPQNLRNAKLSLPFSVRQRAFRKFSANYMFFLAEDQRKDFYQESKIQGGA
jgi:hypothetical protein